MVLEESPKDNLGSQKDEKWILEQIKLGMLLEVKMTKLKLTLGIIMRKQGSLGKTIMR